MRRCNGGFTLTEILITVVIIAIVAAAAVANYGVTVQRARWDAARSVLGKIYEGERYYYSALSPAGTYLGGAPYGVAVCPDQACRDAWTNNLQMDDPNNAGAAVTYQITGGGATFTATATLVGPGTTQTVDDTHVFGGTWNRP